MRRYILKIRLPTSTSIALFLLYIYNFASLTLNPKGHVEKQLAARGEIFFDSQTYPKFLTFIILIL